MLLVPALACVLALVVARSGSVEAHPADRLKQQIVVQLGSTGAQVSLAIGGGILANELVVAQLDLNGDGLVDDGERASWVSTVLRDLHITLDNADVSPVPAAISVFLPKLEDFHLGLSPVLMEFSIPYPTAAAAKDHRLMIRDDYHVDRTDYSLNVDASKGATIVDQGFPGRTSRISFSADPSVAQSGPGKARNAAQLWGSSGVIGRANDLLNRPKTPLLVAGLIAVFVFMGALHAMQPGHGKTLVAAYLVATEGTPKDALTLAGIVTFTHTISVFLLGLLTLAAGHYVLPSRIVPVLGIVSGVLIVGMGLAMLRRTLALWGRSRERRSHHHHHDHGALTPAEHARLHLEDALAARNSERGNVSGRSLVTLGVSGGLAPCPDALAILLLAVGINQTGFGMIAILAFSVGLAGVLVAFGLSIALVGPFWNRMRLRAERRGGIGQRLNALFGRVLTFSPIVSAAVVLVLGIVMIWRAGGGL